MVRRAIIFCPTHWKVVPSEVQRWINRSADNKNARGWRLAVREAVQFIHKLESKGAQKETKKEKEAEAEES